MIDAIIEVAQTVKREEDHYYFFHQKIIFITLNMRDPFNCTRLCNKLEALMYVCIPPMGPGHLFEESYSVYSTQKDQ